MKVMAFKRNIPFTRNAICTNVLLFVAIYILQMLWFCRVKTFGCGICLHIDHFRHIMTLLGERRRLFHSLVSWWTGFLYGCMKFLLMVRSWRVFC